MKKPNAFHIEQKGKRHFYVQAENDTQYASWIDYFKKACTNATFSETPKVTTISILS
jgi:hypothetical protein